MRFSPSKLKTYQDCALRAHYHYDLNLTGTQNAAATFGSVIHIALEYLSLTQDFEGAKKIFLDHWYNPEKYGLEIGIYPQRTSHQSYLSMGLELLKKVYDGEQWDKAEILATEHQFLVPFGKHELNGIVDRIEIRRSGNGARLLRVIDYKTKSKQPTQAELALDIQFTVYIYATSCPEFWLGNPVDPTRYPPIGGTVEAGRALMERCAPMDRRAIWYHVRGPKEIDAGRRLEADYLRLYRLCDMIEKARDAQVFVPRIGEACGLCDYTEECQMEIPVEFAVKKDDPDAWV